VVMVVVRVSSMTPLLRGRRHGGRGQVWFAVDSGRPVEQGRGMRATLEVLGASSRRLGAENAQPWPAGGRRVSVSR
jgi:hypothetical protein